MPCEPSRRSARHNSILLDNKNKLTKHCNFRRLCVWLYGICDKITAKLRLRRSLAGSVWNRWSLRGDSHIVTDFKVRIAENPDRVDARAWGRLNADESFSRECWSRLPTAILPALHLVFLFYETIHYASAHGIHTPRGALAPVIPGLADHFAAPSPLDPLSRTAGEGKDSWRGRPPQTSFRGVFAQIGCDFEARPGLWMVAKAARMISAEDNASGPPE